MEEIKLLMLGKGVAQYYRRNVKGNENASHLDIQKKLTRNVLLAKPVPPKADKPNLRLYLYGQLEILVEDGKRVVWLKNDINANRKHTKINKKRKRKLNQLLNISEQSFSNSLCNSEDCVAEGESNENIASN